MIEGKLIEDPKSGYWAVRSGQQNHWIVPGVKVQVKVNDEWKLAKVIQGAGLSSNRYVLELDGTQIAQGAISRIAL